MPSSRTERRSQKELKRKEPKRKRRKEKKKSRRRSRSSSESSSGGDDDMDLSKEMFPISHYINDKEEMITQVFSVIKGKKLRSMLPPFLVNLDVDELKALCLEQLMGMSRQRIKHVLDGKEMVESSDTDEESVEGAEDAAEKAKDEEDEETEDIEHSVINTDPTAATNLRKAHRIKFKEEEAAKKMSLSMEKKREKTKETVSKEGSEEDEKEKGKTLMELLELEMRARAIKALLMKAGKDEGEAETLAIEEALDEAKKKGNNTKESSPNEEAQDEDDTNEDEKTAKCYDNSNSVMNKAREALILSENKKIIADEVKARKEDEARFMYEEQIRKETSEKEKIEQDRLAAEAKEKRRQMIELEQEERRLKLEKEREKMKEDHAKKEELKKARDKEKLLTKIKEIKDEEQREKDDMDEHFKTKLVTKVIERKSEDDELVLDEDEEQALRRYRKREDDESDGNVVTTEIAEEAGETKVNSDAEDEVDREEDQLALLEKMKNLRSKMKKKTDGLDSSNSESPRSVRGGRGRGRGRGRGKGRGKRTGGSGSDEDSEWKYDFDAPDVADLVKDHKPNFVKAPRRCFEKSDGYYSDKEEDTTKEEEEEEDTHKEEIPEETFKKVTRSEWNKMSYKEKKKYLKERRKWKNRNTKYIKDDSDKEQLTDDDNEDDEKTLEFTDSEDEIEKNDRLAKEALKSYAKNFIPEEHPEDYKLVMRADVVEKELADEDSGTQYETIDDIEMREKNKKLDQKEKERKEKMREERLKRIQAFQAAALLKEGSDVEVDDEEEDDEPIEEQEPTQNPFYSSYKVALENKEELEDPLKEARERGKTKLAEDAAALKQLEEQQELERKRKAEQQLRESEPPSKLVKSEDESTIEMGKLSGIGALKEKLEENKEQIVKELSEEEHRVKLKEVEKVVNKTKRSNPNNPTKEEVDAAQELDTLTWQVRGKQKAEKIQNKPSPVSVLVEEPEKPVKGVQKPKVQALPGMIGSIEEYASLVGTTVNKLAETRYEPPEVSESGEDSDGDGGQEEEGDLWGAIMGGQ